MDIAICNDDHPFTYEEEGQGILFIEGVDCCVEVKTTLNENHLKAAIQNCQSVRELRPEIPEGTTWYKENTSVDRLEMVPYAVFAFESDYSTSGLVEKIDDLNDELGIASSNSIDIIYALDTGLIYNHRQDEFRDSGLVSGYSRVPPEPELLMFLIYLYRMMPSVSHMPNLLEAYFKPNQY